MAVLTVERAIAAAGHSAPSAASSSLTEETIENKYFLKPAIGLGAIAAVFVALAVIANLVHDPTFSQSATAVTPVAGLTIFATFFVAASAIERLLEPLATLLPSSTDAATAADGKVKSAGKAAADENTSAMAAQAKLKAGAKALATSNFTTYCKSVTLWATATVIAMAASAYLRLYFLHAVGISNGTRTIEILATGLIIGAGTKPLHDLVTYLQATSTAKAAS